MKLTDAEIERAWQVAGVTIHSTTQEARLERFARAIEAAVLERLTKVDVKPVLKLHRGELCYKSDADDQTNGMWCPLDWRELEGTFYVPASTLAALQAENERLRRALRFYADKEHFIVSDETAWDTVTGEPQNYWCDEAGTATVEDGSFARAALEAR